MFPLEFDHRVLDSLPLLDDEDAIRVVQILKAIVARRIMPYFRKSKGSDPIAVARVSDHLTIDRLEDRGKPCPCSQPYYAAESGLVHPCPRTYI